MAQPFFAYMLLCSDASFYVGHTDDLPKRVAEHESGVGCEYTAKRLPVTLVWSQEFSTREDAKEAEARLKRWSRAKKQALIRADFDALKTLAKKKDWSRHKERTAQRTTDSEHDHPASPE